MQGGVKGCKGVQVACLNELLKVAAALAAATEARPNGDVGVRSGEAV